MCLTVELSEAHTFLVAMRPGDIPVPIPNTMVKPREADGTAQARGRAGGRQDKKRDRMLSVIRVHGGPCIRMADRTARQRTLKTAYTIYPAYTSIRRRRDADRDRKDIEQQIYCFRFFLGSENETPSRRYGRGRTVKQKGRRADALALGADERRDKLR